MPEESEEGSVEAGLAFIPTTAFFLLVLELVVAGSVKTIETMNLQSWLNKSALYGSDLGGFDSSGFDSSGFDRENRSEITVTTLPGGGEILTISKTSEIPIVSSFAIPFAAKGGFKVFNEAIATRE